LQVAHLTYPYHCCAFAFPAAHDPQEHARHQVRRSKTKQYRVILKIIQLQLLLGHYKQRFIADMQAKYCDKIPGNDSVSLRLGQEQETFGIDVNVHSHPDNIEVFHSDPFQTPLNRELLFHAFCGNLTYALREVRCTPQPDAFK